ncbi:MAG: ABC-F family ATP-binding cassette domain-containing protein [Oscillospiraceae bacterium]|nr:ABC-F family ATP-binding cassette domain-containing protein [Oscillospiraceae bacterium]
MILNVVKLEKSYGERTLFTDASFSIEKGDILGLVGANGVGKTTLFNIILGLESADSGSVVLQNSIKVGHLSQHVCANSDKTTYEETLSIFDHLKNMEARLKELEKLLSMGDLSETESLTLINEQATLIEKYEAQGGLTYVSLTHAVLAGLGFSVEEQNLPVSALSGGQKSKVGLAKLLLEKPDIMLLDEPTNHLDISSVSWLEKFILGSKITAIVISHDRYFLDKICNKVAEIYTGKVFVTEGNYTRHMQLREEMEYSISRNYENTMAEVKRIEGIIEQQKRWNREKNIKTAESKQKQIDRMLSGLEKPEKEKNDITFSFSPYSESGDEVLSLKDVSMQFPGKTLYENVEFSVRKGDAVFIVGENGVGKTTLIKQIMKKGRGISFGVGVVIGYFDQHQLGLNMSKTIIDDVHDAFPALGDTDVRSALARFGFKNDKVFDEISVLSGGERAKVSLCKLMLKRCNFLILDEPTNHLDIYSMAALENALSSYTGTLLVISHDRYFINKLANKIVELKATGTNVIIGNYDTYIEQTLEIGEGGIEPAKSQKEMGAGGKSYQEQKKKRSEQTKLKTAIQRIEREIELLEQEIDDIHIRLSSPEISSDYEKVTELTNLMTEKDDLLTAALLKWEELSNEIM